MKITFSNISTKSLSTLAERVIKSSKNGNFTVTENNPLLLKIEDEYQQYEKAYSKLTYSGKGAEVAEADSKRDKTFNDLKVFLSGYSRIDSVPNSQEAKELYQVIKQLGLKIDRLSYAQETAMMKKIIEELETTENQNKLTALNLTNTFNQLKTEQENFETLYAEQAEANADLHNLPSATELREGLENALRNYFNLLTAMKDVEGWELIYAEINEIVKGITNENH